MSERWCGSIDKHPLSMHYSSREQAGADFDQHCCTHSYTTYLQAGDLCILYLCLTLLGQVGKCMQYIGKMTSNPKLLTRNHAERVFRWGWRVEVQHSTTIMNTTFRVPPESPFDLSVAEKTTNRHLASRFASRISRQLAVLELRLLSVQDPLLDAAG